MLINQHLHLFTRKKCKHNFTFSFFFATTSAHVAHNYNTKSTIIQRDGVPDGHVKEKNQFQAVFFILKQTKNEWAKVKEAGEGILQGKVFHIRTRLSNASYVMTKIAYSCTVLQNILFLQY